MNTAAPDLLTLLRWAAELSAGRRCAPWEAWCSQAPDAASKWERITQAQELLSGAGATIQTVDEIPADNLAAYLDGRMDGAAAQQIEEQLWRSPWRLAEAMSSVQFAAQSPAREPSEQLAQRLVALKPERMNGHAHDSPERYRLAPPASKKPSQWLAPQDWPMTAVVLPEAAGPQRRMTINWSRWQWPAVAATALMAICLTGAIGWLVIGRHDAGGAGAIANRPAIPEVTPQEPSRTPDPSPPSVPEEVVRPESAPHAPLPDDATITTADVPAPAPVEAPSPRPIVPQTEPPATNNAAPPSPAPAPRSPAPAPPRRPGLPPPPELAIHAPIGILLTSGGRSGAWRVAKEHYLLREPTRFLSLSESWTTADIPHVAKLVCDGSTELGLSQLIDGTIEIRLDRGRVAIQGLPEGVEIRVVAGPAVWTARGLADGSTVAVMHDPLSPGLAVPRGHVAIDDQPIDTRQLLRWQNGVLAPYEAAPVVGAVAGTAAAAPVVNPWDLDWLTPPDETRQKQWRSVYGKLVERLSEVNDFEAELARMLATSRDNRHMALLAQWSAGSEPVARRARRIWNMLGERRLPVRIAGVTCLLELPPGDPRREEVLNLLEAATDVMTRGHITEWLNATRQAAPLSQNQAVELSNCLTHEELAVRQIAVSLLELHTTTALLQAGQRPPPYDAAGPAPARGAAQQQWRMLLRKLITPAADNTGRAALGPAALKPVP